MQTNHKVIFLYLAHIFMMNDGHYCQSYNLMNEQGFLYNITIYCTDLELHLWQTENKRLKLTISQIRN